MKKKHRLLYLLVGLFASIILTASLPVMANNQQHCYALITPIEEGVHGSSKIIKAECFDNFSDSIFAATNGRVQLNRSTHPETVTDEALNSSIESSSLSSQVVIGIDWDYTYFGGSSYTWVVSGSGCTSTTQFSVSSMPYGWDNRVSSARGYSGCNYYYHYQNTNFGGSSVACSTTGCATMGILNNATSSEKWRYNP